MKRNTIKPDGCVIYYPGFKTSLWKGVADLSAKINRWALSKMFSSIKKDRREYAMMVDYKDEKKKSEKGGR